VSASRRSEGFRSPRGCESNRLYVDTDYDLDLDTSHDGTSEAQTIRTVLAGCSTRSFPRQAVTTDLGVVGRGGGHPPASRRLPDYCQRRSHPERSRPELPAAYVAMSTPVVVGVLSTRRRPIKLWSDSKRR
jgi:hypothetical protein